MWLGHSFGSSVVALAVVALAIGSPRVIPIGMALGYAADEFPSVARQMGPGFPEQSLGGEASVGINDDTTYLFRNVDERKPFHAAQRPGRCPKPFHRRLSVFDALGEPELGSRRSEADRSPAQRSKRYLCFGNGFSQDIVGIEEGSLYGNDAEVILYGRNHRWHDPLLRPGTQDCRRIEA